MSLDVFEQKLRRRHARIDHAYETVAIVLLVLVGLGLWALGCVADFFYIRWVVSL